MGSGPAGAQGYGSGSYQVPLSKQRSLEGENFRVLQSPYAAANANQGDANSLSRSISFMVKNEYGSRPTPNGDQDGMHERYLGAWHSTSSMVILSASWSGWTWGWRLPRLCWV